MAVALSDPLDDALEWLKSGVFAPELESAGSATECRDDRLSDTTCSLDESAAGVTRSRAPPVSGRLTFEAVREAPPIGLLTSDCGGGVWRDEGSN